MEATLLAMDRTDDTQNNTEYLMSRSEDINRDIESAPRVGSETRPQLMERLEKKALEYGMSPPRPHLTSLICNHAAVLLEKAQSLKGFEQPSPRDYKSVLHFMENGGGQLYEEESAWVYEKSDLVTLRPGREHAWLDGFLESILKVCRCRLLRVSDHHGLEIKRPKLMIS